VSIWFDGLGLFGIFYHRLSWLSDMSLAAGVPIEGGCWILAGTECLCHSAAMPHEGKGFTSFSGGGGSKGRGFVSQIFHLQAQGEHLRRSEVEVVRVGRGAGVSGAVSTLGACSFLVCCNSRRVQWGAFVDAVETGFVTGD
jgi:hypothetical protein